MSTPRDKWDWTKYTVDVLVKLIGIATILFAGLQYYEGQQSERRRTAIEVAAHAKHGEIMEALVRLELHDKEGTLNYPEVNLDAARVMSWYDHLAMLYLYDRVANRCIIKGAVTPYAPLIQRVVDQIQYPRERRAYFDLLLNRMRDETCEMDVAGKT